MSRLIFATVAAGLVTLCACQQAEGPPAVPAEPAPEAAPAMDAPATPPASTSDLSGAATATSSTAMAITGDVEFDGAVIRFGQGIELVTAPERIDLPTAVYDTSGQTWVDLLQVPADAQVEIRRVTAEAVASTARNGGLCGSADAPAATGYVALVQDGDAVSLAVFGAGPAPGPAASETALCGAFLYHFDD